MFNQIRDPSPKLIQKEVFSNKNTYSANEKNFDHTTRVKCS